MKMLSMRAALAVHRDPGAGPFQPIGPGMGREPGALIGIHDLGRAEAMDGLGSRFDAEVRLQRIRDAPGRNFAGAPVHDGRQI